MNKWCKKNDTIIPKFEPKELLLIWIWFYFSFCASWNVLFIIHCKNQEIFIAAILFSCHLTITQLLQIQIEITDSSREVTRQTDITSSVCVRIL